MAKRTAFFFAILCFFLGAYTQLVKAQQIANVAGNWAVAVKMPDKDVSEEWMIKQDGGNITATAKTAQGELPVVGTMDDAGFFRVEVKDGDKQYKVRATVDGDSMDGSITIGSKEYLWSAKRSK